MLDDYLAAIEERCRNATPGPWRARACGEIVAGRHVVATSDGGGGSVWVEWRTDADLKFTAHARSDVPRLIAEIRKLRGMYTRRHMLGLEQGSNVEVITREEAETRRAEILQSIPDEDAFRQQGENFQLNSADLAKYNRLCNLEWLLADREES